MSDSDLYDTDILAWSERQAELLRRIPANDRQNADTPDWPNIIEEIESVGRSETRACKSHLVLALVYDLSADAWPMSQAVSHWRAQARHHWNEAREACAPSMRPRLDLGQIYRRALNELPSTVEAQLPRPVPTVCPATLDELLAEP